VTRNSGSSGRSLRTWLDEAVEWDTRMTFVCRDKVARASCPQRRWGSNMKR
jgi:hypothetical protein